MSIIKKDNWPNLLRILTFICVCSTIAYFIGYVNGRQKPFAPNVQKIIDGERKRLAERAENFVEFHRGRAYQSGYEDGLMAAFIVFCMGVCWRNVTLLSFIDQSVVIVGIIVGIVSAFEAEKRQAQLENNERSI